MPEIRTPDGPMDAFLAMPDPDKKIPVPAVIVIQEAFGVNEHIQDVCGRLAQAGYAALAPELFHREGRGVTLEYGDFSKVMPYMAALTTDGIAGDVRAAISYLRGLPAVS